VVGCALGLTNVGNDDSCIVVNRIGFCEGCELGEINAVGFSVGRPVGNGVGCIVG